MPMLVEISRSTAALIIAHASQPITAAAMGTLPSGNRLLPISDQSYAEFAMKAMPGECVGSVIDRIVALNHRKETH